MINESIFDWNTAIIPMADVQHIELHRYMPDTIEKYNNLFKTINYLFKLIFKSTVYNSEIDDWWNNAYLWKEEASEFLKAWCIYRAEFEWLLSNYITSL